MLTLRETSFVEAQDLGSELLGRSRCSSLANSVASLGLMLPANLLQSGSGT
jgi:hypothetical protein